MQIVIHHLGLLNEVEYTKIFQKLINNRFIYFQLLFLAAKWSGFENLTFGTCHISFGSKTWTLLQKLKILKLVFHVLHYILLPLCDCFTNRFTYHKNYKESGSSEWGSSCFLKSMNSAEPWPFPSVVKKLSKVWHPVKKYHGLWNWSKSCICWLLHPLDLV